MNVEIYTDGSARGNPNGPGGYGVIVVYIDGLGERHEKEYSAGFVKTTNNRMELMAAIIGLESLTKPCDVTLYSDSQYLTNAFNRHWIDGWLKDNWRKGTDKPVKNIDLWQRLLKAIELHNVKFIWVRGHNGDIMNERCDKLATTAADDVNNRKIDSCIN
jgi:ribonuclease HI